MKEKEEKRFNLRLFRSLEIKISNWQICIVRAERRERETWFYGNGERGNNDYNTIKLQAILATLSALRLVKFNSEAASFQRSEVDFLS